MQGHRAEGGDGHSSECVVAVTVAVAVAAIVDVGICRCDNGDGIRDSTHEETDLVREGEVVVVGGGSDARRCCCSRGILISVCFLFRECRSSECSEGEVPLRWSTGVVRVSGEALQPYNSLIQVYN